ncbi:MAG: hypothetical protein P4L16_03135 [Chlamydiales bacterium]|nr:hypothetical protein [Chlamydiales bacterium]
MKIPNDELISILATKIKQVLWISWEDGHLINGSEIAVFLSKRVI